MGPAFIVICGVMCDENTGSMKGIVTPKLQNSICEDEMVESFLIYNAFHRTGPLNVKSKSVLIVAVLPIKKVKPAPHSYGIYSKGFPIKFRVPIQ